MKKSAQTSHLDCSGFTLIEVMIALFVLVVGLLGLTKLQTTFIHSNTKSQSIIGSALTATAGNERLFYTEYGDAILDTGDHQGSALGILDTDSTYQATYTVTENSSMTTMLALNENFPGYGAKLVTLQVTSPAMASGQSITTSLIKLENK